MKNTRNKVDQTRALSNPFTLHELFEKAEYFFPEKVYLYHSSTKLKYKEFVKLGKILTSILFNSNCKRNDAILIYQENNIYTPIFIYACSILGCKCVPISPNFSNERLRFIIEDCRPSLVFTENKEPFKYFKIQTINTRQLKNKIKTTKIIELKYIREEIIDLDILLLLYTSGSTGFPKGVALSHSNIISVTESISRYLNICSDDRILNFNPFHFDYGLFQIFITASRACTLFLKDNFIYKNDIFHFIKLKKISIIPMVPTQILSIINNCSGVYNTVQKITSTGAPLPTKNLEKLNTMFPNAEIYSMYGLTECKRVAYLKPKLLNIKPTSVGRAIPNTRINIVDDCHIELKSNMIGQLVVQGRNVMHGYINNIQENEKIFYRNNPLEPITMLTGDYFYKDDDGDLFFVGRRDDIFKTHGQRISTKDIERCILQNKQVDSVAVIGKYDINNNAEFLAIVEKNNNCLTEVEIKKFISVRVEISYMIPKKIIFIDKLPKNENGKVDYEKLKSIYFNLTI